MTLDDLVFQSFGSMSDLIRWQAQHRPDRVALVYGETQIDFAAFDRQVDGVAAALQRDGLRPGDVAAICAHNDIAYVATIFGCVRAGVAFTPLAPSATPQHRNAMLHNAGARVLFCDRDSAAGWVQLCDGLPHTIALDGSEAGTPWRDWIVAAEPASIDPQPDWPFNLIYSSGTTGMPKGIVQPWRMRWTHVQRARSNGYGEDAVTLAATPLYSNTTLVSALPALALGGTVVLMRKFDVRDYLELAQRYRATHSMLVPIQYQRLMASPDFDRFDLSAFRAKFSTGAPFHAELKAEVVRRWPGALIELYGMTEGGGRCELHAHLYPSKLHTVGKPIEGHEMRLIDDAGVEVAPGGTGEIVGRSPAMMSGYHGLPEKTREAEWFDAAGTRFIRTGDVGRFDEDGFLILGDRKKDMIISGGFNIYPSDIEAALSRHPDVQECAVVGVPSEQWGETPLAFVVARAGGVAPAAQDLKRWINDRVGKTQRVADVRMIDALPRSPIGKVLKRELQQQVAAAQLADAG